MTDAGHATLRLNGPQEIDGVGWVNDPAMAAEIVRRWNHHAALVEALRVADDNIYCECVLNEPPQPDVLCKPHAIIRAVLDAVDSQERTASA